MTNNSVDDEFNNKFKFDRNVVDIYPSLKSNMQQSPKESVKDDLPPHAFWSNAKLFMGVWHDTNESPCLEIIEDMYEPMDDVFITCATKNQILSTCIDSTETELNSVYDYVQYLVNWTEVKCFRRSKTDTLKRVMHKKISNVVNKRSSRYKYCKMIISSALDFIKTLYYALSIIVDVTVTVSIGICAGVMCVQSS